MSAVAQRNAEHAGEGTRIEFASLPPVSEVEDIRTRQRVVALLEQLDKTTAELQELEKRDEALKQELQELQHASGKTGFRYGLLCFLAQQVKGRRTLDRMLLMENGCPASVIEQSFKEGTGSVRRTFKRLPEEG